MFNFLRSLFFALPKDRRAEGRKFAAGYTGSRADLENFVDGAKIFGNFDDFDRGIEDFLREGK